MNKCGSTTVNCEEGYCGYMHATYSTSACYWRNLGSYQQGYWYPADYPKPSDGRCTARWTSSAKTALQKDPLDPDCDANSCVFDGTCRLR